MAQDKHLCQIYFMRWESFADKTIIASGVGTMEFKDPSIVSGLLYVNYCDWKNTCLNIVWEVAYRYKKNDNDHLTIASRFPMITPK